MAIFRNAMDMSRSRKQGLVDALGGGAADPPPNPALGNTGVSGGLPVLGAQPVSTGGTPIGGGDKLNILAARSGPIDPAEQSAYNNTMADIQRRTAALDPLTGGAALAGLGREQEAAQRKFFGEGYAGGGGMQSPPFKEAAPNGGPLGLSPASNYGRTIGFDAGKFNDPNKHDFKYDVGRTLSQFDPKGGFTPEVLAELNKLGYGSFSGSGDKLSLSGAKNAKDAADFANQDWIYAHDAQNDATKWNFGGGGAAGDAGAPGGQGAGMNAGRPSFAGSTVAPMLQADAQSSIQQALQNIGGLSNNSRIQQLIAALSGGGQ